MSNLARIDAIDRRILKALQSDGRMSNLALARQVGLTPTPCQERVKRLERDGYISGYAARLDPVLLDLGLLVFVQVTLDRTTTGHGLPAELDAKAIDKLVVRADGQETRDPVPRFNAVTAWAARTNDARLMLDIKKTPPALVAPAVRKNKIVDRVIVLTFDPATARDAIAADPDWLISVLTPDEATLSSYVALFGKRRFAAYAPAFAPPALFRAAHDAGAVVVSDAMAKGPDGSTDDQANLKGIATYAQSQAERPADLFVTDYAGRLPGCLKR